MEKTHTNGEKNITSKNFTDVENPYTITFDDLYIAYISYLDNITNQMKETYIQHTNNKNPITEEQFNNIKDKILKELNTIAAR